MSNATAGDAAFFDLSCELYCSLDVRTGKLSLLRGSWTNSLGHAEADLLDTPIWSFFHADDVETVRTAFEMTAEASERSRFVGRLRTKDGTFRMFEWTAKSDGEEGTVIAAARDVSELRDLLQRAQRQEELMGQVARGAPVVISVYDREGIILTQIGAGLDKLGLGQNQLQGVSVFDAFKGADDALRHITNALKGQQSTNTQNLGATVWDNWFSPIRNVDGEVTSAISISTDVTERDLARRELEERLRFIEEQGQAIRVMSTPIIEVWQGVLVVPVVGRLDAERAADMMERLLAVVVERGATHTILDLTAVEDLDTTTAEHLLRMIQALSLLGTQGLLSGIRPSVARALIELGIDLGKVRSLSSLHAALRLCMGNVSRRKSRQ